MILKALTDHYEALSARGEIARTGWGPERVSFALVLSEGGDLEQLIPLVTQVERGKKMVDVPRTFTVPVRVKRTVGIKSNFLCDNSSYFFGFDDKGKAARSMECFAAAKALHQNLLVDVDHPAARAICRYFDRWQPEATHEHPALLPYLDSLASANLLFMVGDNFAPDIPVIQVAWQRHYDDNDSLAKSFCLVTGRMDAIPAIHGAVKGIPGAQTAGASLVSFNAPAYHSYGIEDNEADVPIGAYAAFAYVSALNHLISDRDHRFQVGDTLVVYWAERAEPEPQAMFSLFATPKPDENARLAGIMDNVRRGLPVAGVDMQSRFYVLGISPNAARLSVRFFHVDSFGNILDNLCAHYDRLEVVRPSFDPLIYLSPYHLLNETVNPNSRDKAASPLLAGALMQAILTGGSYPASLYSAVMIRIRAERHISRGKAAIIKACLIKQPDNNHQIDKEVLTVSLNHESTNRAYVLGRLFALLEQAQQAANPGLNTTIKDRYFTSACATPGSVFPTLLKLSTAHIKKASNGRWLEGEKAKLIDKLELDNNPLPTHQSLQDQGIFMLGYYHQVQARYTKKEEE